MNDNTPVELLAWDSAWLGLPVGRATAQTPGQVAEAVAQSKAAGIQLLYLVVDSAAEAAIDGARRAGAWLADVRLTYQMPLPGPSLPANAALPASDISYVPVREFSAGLNQLAQQSSQYSRFRLDNRIPDHACDELYTQWLQQALTNGNVWAAMRQRTPVGLLALGLRQGHASIELLAVSPAARHQRIGLGLVQVAQREACRQEQPLLQVVTQQANSPAQLFYQHCRFQLAHREHVFHLWLHPE